MEEKSASRNLFWRVRVACGAGRVIKDLQTESDKGMKVMIIKLKAKKDGDPHRVQVYISIHLFVYQ